MRASLIPQLRGLLPADPRSNTGKRRGLRGCTTILTDRTPPSDLWPRGVVLRTTICSARKGHAGPHATAIAGDWSEV